MRQQVLKTFAQTAAGKPGIDAQCDGWETIGYLLAVPETQHQIPLHKMIAHPQKGFLAALVSIIIREVYSRWDDLPGQAPILLLALGDEYGLHILQQGLDIF
jgi:hypothetical protein